METIQYKIDAKELGFIWTRKGKPPEEFFVTIPWEEEIEIKVSIINIPYGVLEDEKGEKSSDGNKEDKKYERRKAKKLRDGRKHDKVCEHNKDEARKENKDLEILQYPPIFLVEKFLEKVVADNQIQCLYIFDQEQEQEVEEINEVIITILHHFVNDLNQLVIVTKYPEKYQAILEEIFMETGLIGICMEETGGRLERGKFGGQVETHARHVKAYARHVETYARQVETYARQVETYARQVETYARHIETYALIKEQKIFILDLTREKVIKYRDLPEQGIYFDLYSKKEKEYILSVKKPKLIYESVAKFLDRVVKNRYNTIVNEGNVNLWDEKDNKWKDQMLSWLKRKPLYPKKGNYDGS